MFVGNARQSAYFYRNAFGFDVVAYAGLETGVRHEACYVLRQGNITFVLGLAAPARPSRRPAADEHGDGVQSIALEVDDVAAPSRPPWPGARSPRPRPRTVEDEHGAIDLAEIHAYGDTTHTFVNRSRYRGVFAPGFRPLDPGRYSPPTFHPVACGRSTTSSPTSREQDGRLGRLLQQVMGFSLLASFDVQGHQHRVLAL